MDMEVTGVGEQGWKIAGAEYSTKFNQTRLQQSDKLHIPR